MRTLSQWGKLHGPQERRADCRRDRSRLATPSHCPGDRFRMVGSWTPSASTSRCGSGITAYSMRTWWIVYCFADAEHAEKFRMRFGGERFNPKDRGRGSNWARWYKDG